MLARRSEEYLSDVPPAVPERIPRGERPGWSRDRLQAAALEWLGRTLERMADSGGQLDPIDPPTPVRTDGV